MVSRAAVEAETATTSTTEPMSSGLSLFALSSSCLLLAFVSLVILCLLLFLLFFLLISVGRSLGVITGKSKRDQVEAVLLFLLSVLFHGPHTKRFWETGIGVFAGLLLSIYYPLAFVGVIGR